MTHARVAIVIVTFNSGAEIGGCLDAIAAIKTADAIETVVVDNASSDSTRVEAGRRNVRVLANAENRGFAAAVNQGVRATSAPLVLLLNPDAHLTQDLDALAARFGGARTGAAGGLLVGRNGKPQTGFFARRIPTPLTLIFEVLGVNRLWPRNPVNWHYRCFSLDPMTAQLVDQPAGAFLMFRRTAWSELGGFDERFWPIWFEDVDFCARLRSAGWNVWYEPKAVAIHSGAHSIRSLSLENRERYWYGSLLGYAAKHFGPSGFRAVCLAVAADAAGRVVGGCLRGRLKNLGVYARICRLALRRFFRPARDAGPLLSDVRRQIR